MPRNVLAVILGGGRGTRLYPLTKYRSKPAVPIGGKYRLIDVPVSNCIHSRINSIYVLTQFNSASLNRHINQTYQFAPFAPGFVEILAAEQTMDNTDWYQGTADAVRQNLRFFSGRKFDHILILSGDHLYRMDYQEFLDTHLERGNDVTVSVQPVGSDAAPGLGILRTSDDGDISEFVEKPTDPGVLESLRLPGAPEEQSFMASMGIYLFRRDVLMDLLESGDEEDFGRQVIPRAIETRKVSAHRFDGYWADIGTIKAFHETSLACLQDDSPFDFYEPDRPMYTRPRFLPSTKVDHCHLINSMISEGSIITDATVANSIIGIRSIVSRDVTIEDSVIMGADFYEDDARKAAKTRDGSPIVGIGPGCAIRNAIIDKNARIGEGCRIVNVDGVQSAETDTYWISDGVVVVPKNATIPPGTVI